MTDLSPWMTHPRPVALRKGIPLDYQCLWADWIGMKPTRCQIRMVIKLVQMSLTPDRDASPNPAHSRPLYFPGYPFFERNYHSSFPAHGTYLRLHHNWRCVTTVRYSGFNVCILNTGSGDRWARHCESVNRKWKHYCASFGSWREVSGSTTAK